jgi:rhodanese-related sulfurtransferase
LKLLNAETLDMKKIYSMLALILVLTGCMFQKPDYVKSITPAQLNQLMHTEDIFLVDVHTPEQQHIKGTDLFIPYNEIEKYKDKFPKDKNTPIYLYCEGGPMGNAAGRSLHELGYENISNLEGGANAWRKAGLDFE